MWRALVMHGGGVAVEFQVGVINTMGAVFDRVDFFTGTGMGTLSAAVLAQYDRLNHGAVALQRVWNAIQDADDIIDAPWQGMSAAMAAAIASSRSWAPDSVCGNRPLRNLVQDHVSWSRLEGKGNWAAPIASLTDGNPYVVTNHATLMARLSGAGRMALSTDSQQPGYIGPHITDLITAACSTPLLMPPVDVFGHRLVTGQIQGLWALELATEAALLMIGGDVEAEGEIVVLENNPTGLRHAEMHDLDSGREIALRALRMWSSSMLSAELGKAQNRLENHPNIHIRLIRPQLDHGLHPLAFDNVAERLGLRHHGASRATSIFGHGSRYQGEASMHRAAIDAVCEDPTCGNAIKQMVTLTKQDPVGARAAREAVSRELRSVGGAISAAVSDAAEVVADATPPGDGPVDELREAAHLARHLHPRPENLRQLIEAVQFAVLADLPLKAVGANFAFDNINKTSGQQILTDELNRILEVDRTLLHEPELADRLCRFEAGATVRSVNRHLWSRGQALLNQPGYEKLSYVGSMSVSAHGSGIGIGPLPDQVRSVRLVTVDANKNVIHQCIEPENGITDPTRFALSTPGVKLIQDDDVFNAVTVGLGCLGIIYSVTVEVREAYFLEEEREFTSWEELAAGRLATILVDTSVHSLHVWLNPYEVDNRHGATISVYKRVAGPRRGHRALSVTWGGVDEIAPLLLWVMEHFPSAIPRMMDESLESVVPDEAPVLPCYEALNFGAPNEIDVLAAACGVPATDAIAAGNAIIERMAESCAQGAYVTSPIGFRFVKGTDALLGMQHGRDTCMIELPLLEGTDYARSTLDVFHDLLITQFGGRPHWGQINRTLNAERMKAIFPDSLEPFLRVFRAYNPIGVFDNQFTAELGLRELADQLNDQGTR